MPKVSAGILLYRMEASDIEVLIAHPGGPYWAKKDNGAWSIPKGIVEPGEEPKAAARREFIEEIGSDPGEPVVDLGEVKMRGGKIIRAWAIEGDLNPDDLDSNEIEIEFPWRSGRKIRFPEVDRVMWAKPQVARKKLNPAQGALVDRLVQSIDLGG
ncbi:MAG: NUDIX domain-containing protein [Acidimicrobiia bacterium]|nr:NUDIX domain-containing protein [Acidimicrobiia bacterium]